MLESYARCRDAPASLMLVCKQWQRVYLSTPALHSRLKLSVPDASQPDYVARWVALTSQQLQAVGRLCSSLTVTTATAAYPGYTHSGTHTVWHS